MPLEILSRDRIVVLAAHPDDETVGAGGALMRMRSPVLIHVTDGAPRNLADARAAGYETREDYAAARREELWNALQTAGLVSSDGEPDEGRAGQLENSADLLPFGVVDQEASLDMAGMARRLAEFLQARRPPAILTNAYEGGHPDHDATSFAAHAACSLIPAPPPIYEFPLYHAYQGEAPETGFPKMETGRFLPAQEPGRAITLSNSDRELKQRMIQCFATQAHMLRHFPVDEERFRASPAYDFSQPPHSGKLFYEYFEWGMTGERWRALAADAARELGVPLVL